MRTRLAAQLTQLRVELALHPERHEVRVRIAAGQRELQRIAHASDAELLPKLLAKFARGEITTDQAGAAIARDGALAAQVMIATGGGDYAERDVDKRSGTFVEGNQYHLYFGGPPRE